MRHNFIVLDRAGREQLWIRANEKLWSKIIKIQEYCKEKEQDINAVLLKAIKLPK